MKKVLLMFLLTSGFSFANAETVNIIGNTCELVGGGSCFDGYQYFDDGKIACYSQYSASCISGNCERNIFAKLRDVHGNLFCNSYNELCIIKADAGKTKNGKTEIKKIISVKTITTNPRADYYGMGLCTYVKLSSYTVAK